MGRGHCPTFQLWWGVIGISTGRGPGECFLPSLAGGRPVAGFCLWSRPRWRSFEAPGTLPRRGVPSPIQRAKGLALTIRGFTEVACGAIPKVSQPQFCIVSLFFDVTVFRTTMALQYMSTPFLLAMLTILIRKGHLAHNIPR